MSLPPSALRLKGSVQNERSREGGADGPGVLDAVALAEVGGAAGAAGGDVGGQLGDVGVVLVQDDVAGVGSGYEEIHSLRGRTVVARFPPGRTRRQC